MSLQPPTRESLLAEWEKLRPSQPLSEEILNLLLQHFKRSKEGQQINSPDVASQHRDISANLPPPQRYQRLALACDRPPVGPMKHPKSSINYKDPTNSNIPSPHHVKCWPPTGPSLNS